MYIVCLSSQLSITLVQSRTDQSFPIPVPFDLNLLISKGSDTFRNLVCCPLKLCSEITDLSGLLLFRLKNYGFSASTEIIQKPN